MSKNTKEQEIPYSYLVDNIKIFLIFLVVFNHIIAFQLVKADQVVRFVWYGITIFHMPAFIFISGYLSKKPQDVMKNVKNLLIPYILGYTLTWAAQIWLGNKMDYELLRPSGTVMWYVLALFAYRLTIEAFGKNKVYCTSQHYFCAVGRNQNGIQYIFISFKNCGIFPVFCGRIFMEE